MYEMKFCGLFEKVRKYVRRKFVGARRYGN
jgi:hypothetical protein